jgi:hypothetical protein
MNRKQTSKPGSMTAISAPYFSLPNFTKIEGVGRCKIAGAAYGSGRAQLRICR